MEVAFGVMPPQAGECQELLAATRGWGRGMEQTLPRGFQKVPALSSPWF